MREPSMAVVDGMVHKSSYHLALTTLIQELLDVMWDILIVDGRSAARPKKPSQMTTIYNTVALAHATTMTGGWQVDMAMHDVDHMVEQWYT
ncbi:hypothetical protein GUJ93_ZPchr0002g25098 [Zizania palustris]|uniref:Uncharacterized protein n=1 Tax=Zizania palustris TaxID=103762 RepID=A0A8J5RSP3_ZIZPA|nr:hypothetical protein GUJ93_ZPchr0002g25098 [Zizania palustris]